MLIGRRDLYKKSLNEFESYRLSHMSPNLRDHSTNLFLCMGGHRLCFERAEGGGFIHRN